MLEKVRAGLHGEPTDTAAHGVLPEIAAEFRRQPFGHHSEELQNVLHQMRSAPMAGKHFLFMAESQQLWVLGRYSDGPPYVPIVDWETAFDDLEEAEWHVFKAALAGAVRRGAGGMSLTTAHLDDERANGCCGRRRCSAMPIDARCAPANASRSSSAAPARATTTPRWSSCSPPTSADRSAVQNSPGRRALQRHPPRRRPAHPHRLVPARPGPLPIGSRLAPRGHGMADHRRPHAATIATITAADGAITVTSDRQRCAPPSAVRPEPCWHRRCPRCARRVGHDRRDRRRCGRLGHHRDDTVAHARRTQPLRHHRDGHLAGGTADVRRRTAHARRHPLGDHHDPRSCFNGRPRHRPCPMVPIRRR